MTLLLLPLLVVSTAIVRCGSRDLCNVCSCQGDEEHKGLSVDCSNRSLKQIPRHLPPDTTRLILRHNQIQEIDSNVFNNTKLRHIDLSNNQLRKILPLSFQGADKLLSLDLHSNKLSLKNESYPEESFNSLFNLQLLDISENLVNTRGDVDDKYPDTTLSKLVSLQTLKIDGIHKLELGEGFARLLELRFLNFSGNCETMYLTNTTFRNVKNIHALILSGCKLQDIHESAFGVFQNLQFLDISFNHNLGLNKATSALRSLHSSQFNILNITAVEKIFGIGLKVKKTYFKNIQHLPITQIYMNRNRIELFSAESIASLPATVKFVGLRDNIIAYGPYILATFLDHNLHCIDVSYQYVSHMPTDINQKINAWNYISHHCDGLQNYMEISETYMANSNTRNPMPGQIVTYKLSSTNKTMKPMHVEPDSSSFVEKENKSENEANKTYMKTGNILKSNTTAITFKQSSNSQIVPTTKQSSIPYGLSKPIHETVLMNKFVKRDVRKDLQLVKSGSASLKHQLLRFKRGIPIPLPFNLRYFNGSTSKFSHEIPKIRFLTNNVKVLDISSNIMQKWIGPIFGLHHLEWLSLANNLCSELHKGFFTDMGSLKHLFMGSNYLNDPFESDVNGDILKPLKNLETIDISNNRLRIFPSSLLCGLRSLKRLDVSKNLVNEWTLTVDHMHQLEFINMSRNMLTTLPASLRNFADRQYANNKKLVIDMNGQLLTCHCENLEFYKWMERNTTLFVNRRQYKCRTSEGDQLSLENLDKVIMHLEKKCVSWTLTIIIMTCSVALIGLIIVVALTYRYRWKIRYVYYLARSKYRGYYAERLEANTEFTYDAFISYADNDRSFVVRQMIQNLETIKGRQLCIHHRDFLVGEIIAANILNAVRNSRKTVIILTKNFLKSYWCMYELNMAMMEGLATGRNVLIVVVYESIPLEELPNDIVQLMSTNSYLEYPTDPEGHSLFWENLSVSISVD